MTQRVPGFLKRYFWDVRFEQLERQHAPRFIVERILEYGDPRAIQWLQRQFPARTIREALKQSRSLSVRSANFWAKMYRVNRREVRCLSKSSQRRRAQHWFV